MTTTRDEAVTITFAIGERSVTRAVADLNDAQLIALAAFFLRAAIGTLRRVRRDG